MDGIHPDIAGVILIRVPCQWILDDVFADAIQIGAISDDVLVVIALPTKRQESFQLNPLTMDPRFIL